jgi:L-alanine-DL-glutamate epimerase-like enolase superfamily enzyme
MQIACAQLYPLEMPMSKPIKMAGETVASAHTVLLRLVDEQGRQGWGEASAAPLMTGETLGSLAASIEYLAAQLVGAHFAEPADVARLQDRVLYGNASAKACYETALMDLFAQARGLPLHRLLAGGSVPAPAGQLEMLHMLASGDLEGEIEEARVLRREGYRHWKIKVGSGDAANDIRRVRALCAELRGDVVSADANQSLSVEAAMAIAAAGSACGLAFLEQPYRTGKMDAMTTLHAASGLPLCADESIQHIEDIDAHCCAHAAQGVSLKLIKLGGLLPLVEAGRLCLSRGMRINLACKVAETTISAAATAHAGFALGDIAWGFSMSNRYLAADVCEHPLAPRSGVVTADQAERPGLGFAPEAARLREFASAALPVREFRR